MIYYDKIFNFRRNLSKHLNSHILKFYTIYLSQNLEVRLNVQNWKKIRLLNVKRPTFFHNIGKI